MCFYAVLSSGKLNAQVSDLSVNPGLSIRSQGSKWETIKTGINYPSYAGEWAQYHLKEDSSIKLYISSRFIDRMDLDVDKTIGLYEEDLRKNGGEKKLAADKIILSATVEEKGKKYFVENIFIFNLMFFTQVNISFPAENKTSKAIVSELPGLIRLDSPHETDLKEGLPVTADRFDSLVITETARLTEILQKMYYPKLLQEHEISQLKNSIRRDLNKKMQGGYTYEKYYGYRNKILKADFSVSDVMSALFKKKGFPELKFVEDFDNSHNGKLYDALITKMENISLATLGYNDKGISKLADRISKERRADSVYWALFAAAKDNHSPGKLYAFSFKETAAGWTIRHYALGQSFNLEDKTIDLNNDFHLTHYAGDDTTSTEDSDDILLVTNNHTQQSFIGNAFSDSTMFYTTGSPAPDKYDVSYMLFHWGPHSLNGFPSYRNKKITNDYHMQEYAQAIPPASRIYFNVPTMGDVNGNGLADCYSYSISNGKLLNINVFEVTNGGIQQLSADADIKNKIAADYNVVHAIHISEQKENNSDFYGADLLQLYDEKDSTIIFKDSLNPLVAPYLVNDPGDSATKYFTAFMNCRRMKDIMNMYAPVDFAKMNFTGVKSCTIMSGDLKVYEAAFYPDGKYRSMYYYESSSVPPETNLSFDYNTKDQFVLVKDIANGKRTTAYRIYAKGDTIIPVRVYPSLIFKQKGQLVEKNWDRENNSWDTKPAESIYDSKPCPPGNTRCNYRKTGENTFQYDDANHMTAPNNKQVFYPFAEKIVFNKRGLLESFSRKEVNFSQHFEIRYTYY